MYIWSTVLTQRWLQCRSEMTFRPPKHWNSRKIVGRDSEQPAFRRSRTPLILELEHSCILEYWRCMAGRTR